MSPEELKCQKEIAFFGASVEAWYNTSLEHDKSIFALSGGGIGLLITLLTTMGVSSILTLILYGAAILCFVAVLVMLLIIFRKNRKHIVAVLNCETVVDDPLLKRLDFIVLCAFGAGVVFTSFVGVVSAYDSYVDKVTQIKEKAMANEKTQSPRGNIANESFTGMATLTKSFNGLSSIRPPSANPTPTPAPAQPAQSNGSGNSGGSTPSGGNGPQR